MSNSTVNKLNGLGSMTDVLNAWLEVPEIDGGFEGSLTNMTALISSMADQPYTCKAVNAILCAFLNRHIMYTGRIWYLKDDGNMASQFFATDSERKLFADLAGIPIPKQG